MTPAARAGGRPATTRPGGGDLLTPAEVAEYLRTTTGVLAKWRYLGTGPAYVKSGRSVRYRRDAVEAHLAA